MSEHNQKSQSFPVKIFINEPQGEITGHTVGVSNDVDITDLERGVYYRAIKEVLSGKEFYPYFRDKDNIRGFEVLTDPPKEELEALIPDIHERARTIFKGIEDIKDSERILKMV